MCYPVRTHSMSSSSKSSSEASSDSRASFMCGAACVVVSEDQVGFGREDRPLDPNSWLSSDV